MKKITVLLIFFIIGTSVFAQDYVGMRGSEICSRKKQNRTSFVNPADLSPNTPRHSYDVLNYKLNLDIYNCFKSAVQF